VFFMFHVKFVHYMLKKRQLAKRPLMCPRLFFFKFVLKQHEFVLKQHEFLCYENFSIQNLPLCNTKISTRKYFNTLAISNTGVLSVLNV
jgi:hypothetical protein